MPNTPHWLTARPIAHRGLHDQTQGLVENTIPAFDAAIERGFAIELDVQLTADNDAVVFHDHTLNRLTGETGSVVARACQDLQKIDVIGAGTKIPSLAKVLAHVDGRTPLIVELKSRFDRELALADAVAGAIAAYPGPLALMSFDPTLISHLHKHNTGRPLGVVAASMGYEHWGELSIWKRFQYGALLHGPGLWCDFVSYSQANLPALSPWLAKAFGQKALLCWTVKDVQTAKRVARHVDAITFEGFDPYGVPL